MMVFTKVLFGSIRITAYDWKDQTDSYLRGMYIAHNLSMALLTIGFEVI